MKRFVVGLILAVLAWCGLSAQEKGELVRVVLNTGAEKVGTVRFANDAVLVVVDAEGAAFQYLRTEIQLVERNWKAPVDTTEVPVNRPVSAQFALSGGYKCVEADFFIGHRSVTQQQLFLGGGLGYHMEFVEGGLWHFLPVMARVELPFLPENKVTPYVGLNAGYAFALGHERKSSVALKGGALGELDFGARFTLKHGSQFGLSAFGRVQGYGSSNVTIAIDDAQQTTQEYAMAGHRMLWNVGVRLAITL